jgi:hypothetical protein
MWCVEDVCVCVGALPVLCTSSSCENNKILRRDDAFWFHDDCGFDMDDRFDQC